MAKNKILVIGDVYVDFHIDKEMNEGYLLRLGGVFHSLRALSTLPCEVEVLYFSPNYLDQNIIKYLSKLNIKTYLKLGEINGSPNVMLINNSKEIYNQEYQDLLRDERTIDKGSCFDDLDKFLENNEYSNILIFSTACNVHEYFFTHELNINCSIYFDVLNLKIEGLVNSKDNYNYFFSTTSTINNLSANKLLDLFKENEIKYNSIIFKENRGGTLIFIDDSIFNIPAYIVECMHSIGLGDVFDAVYIYFNNNDIVEAGKLSAYITMLYCQTYDFNLFIANVKKLFNDKLDLPLGIRLPYDLRRNKIIYLAGPDFALNQITVFDEIAKSLEFHNFRVIRPIKENGLISDDTNRLEITSIINKDMDDLNNANIMIAIVPYDDSGTYAEIGYFYAMGKKVILFDPKNIVKNYFVLKCVYKKVIDINQLLTIIFSILGEKK